MNKSIARTFKVCHFVALCLTVLVQSAFAGDMEADAVGLKPMPESLPASGLTVYVDPQTGAFLKEPAPGHVPLQLSPKLQSALSTSHKGLVESPSTLPGQGVKVDLQGRFQSPLFITLDADGKATVRHLHPSPQSDAKQQPSGIPMGGAKDGAP